MISLRRYPGYGKMRWILLESLRRSVGPIPAEGGAQVRYLPVAIDP